MVETEAAAAGRRPGTGSLSQFDEWPFVVSRAEQRARRIAVQDAHSQIGFVVGNRASQIGDLQMDGPESCAVRQPITARRLAVAARRRGLRAFSATKDLVRGYARLPGLR